MLGLKRKFIATIGRFRKKYPCDMALQQLYLVPREFTDLRFCPYHGVNAVELEEISYKELQKVYNQNLELNRRRRHYLNFNFKEAGCKKGCILWNKYKGYFADDFRNRDGSFRLETLWMSLGPDCNIRCRYCLENQAIGADGFNTATPSI